MLIDFRELLSGSGNEISYPANIDMTSLDDGVNKYPVIRKEPFVIQAYKTGKDKVQIQCEGSVTLSIPCDRCLEPVEINIDFNVDDVIETANHFRCIDLLIDKAKTALSEKLIKELHFILKTGTSDARKDWFAVGDYKKLPNEVGGRDTALPEEVSEQMRALLAKYNAKKSKTVKDILDFHVCFERIHPFQDGNGRVGRLIMFKECLKYNIVPFIIEDNLKMFYYRGLKEWGKENGFLMDTCLAAQDRYKAYLDYFRIAY